MKRKLDIFQKKLDYVVKNKANMKLEKFESFLLEKIIKGSFDNNFCKKGRKRNYNQFFEKHQLTPFIVKRFQNNNEVVIEQEIYPPKIEII